MARKPTVSAVLYEVLRMFSICPVMPQWEREKIVVSSSGKALVRVTTSSIESVVPSLTDSVFRVGSTLPNEFVSMDHVRELVKRIQSHIKRVDHIGFCYTVASWEYERARIIKEVAKTNWHLYEMESTDLAKWYFIGDKARWQDPMIELLPALPNDDPDRPYWMPHIHLDINTSLSADHIIQVITHIFGDTRKPISYTDPTRGTHCVRMWLGVVSGVNINLDLSTKVRNLEWVRANMLHKIVL